IVMNESLSGPTFPFNLVNSNAIREAGNAGILDVVAAGNDAQNLVAAPVSPATLSLSLPNVITVGAVDNVGKLAIFSNFGTGVDLAAPGVNILSTAPTSGISVVTPLDPADPIAVPYGFLSGTSQAAPQVAGIIALEAAVRPNATPAQYKKALLDGVTPDQNLESVNSLPPKVSTGGIANAFNAVRNINAQFAKADAVRMGSWHNFYGLQGAYVVGESTTFPSFVTASFNGVSPVILHDSTRNVVALQKVSDPSDRIAAYDASATSETIDLNFTDGLLHRVSLYVADQDFRNRTETMQILDANNPAIVFDTQVASKFFHGQYFSWDLSGHVQIRITNSGGPSAVFSGIFFDAPPGNPNAFAGQDSTTLGFDWRHRFGSQGSVIVGDDNTNALPDYIPVPNFDVRFASGDSASHNRILRQTIKAAVVPQKNFDPRYGVAAEWFDQDHFDISMIPNDSLAHKVTLYAVDYGNRGRTERIDAIDQNTGSVLYTQDLSRFAHGTYVSFVVSGPTLFRVSNTGGPDAVVSAMYFDAPPGEKLAYNGADFLTRGNWRQAGYGLTRQYDAGENMPGVDQPNDVFFSSVNASRLVLQNPSSDVRAPEDVNQFSAGRVMGYAFTNTQMSFTLSIADHEQHQLALYFVDYENHHRREAITITDPTTGQVLARHRIANFAGSEYLVYQIRGSVVITINNEGSPNAVLNGVFLT
ncbi:MAG TPA: S8 family serine peptidase, partial [Tepidisphaeraceae bacterium]|nr:S8 family serine peptidase [Tepidisphaeraceae bacterium]